MTKTRAAIALLQSWIDAEEDREQRRTLELLKITIDEDRIEGRKLYGVPAMTEQCCETCQWDGYCPTCDGKPRDLRPGEFCPSYQSMWYEATADAERRERLLAWNT